MISDKFDAYGKSYGPWIEHTDNWPGGPKYYRVVKEVVWDRQGLMYHAEYNEYLDNVFELMKDD